MRIADDEVNAGQRSDFFRRPLSVAAGDDDSRVRVLAAHAPDGSTRILIRTVGYRAGVQDYDGRLPDAGCARQAPLFELAFKSRPIGLGSAASKIFYKEFGHTLWYRTPESV